MIGSTAVYYCIVMSWGAARSGLHLRARPALSGAGLRGAARGGLALQQWRQGPSSRGARGVLGPLWGGPPWEASAQLPSQLCIVFCLSLFSVRRHTLDGDLLTLTGFPIPPQAPLQPSLQRKVSETPLGSHLLYDNADDHRVGVTRLARWA